MLDLSKANDRFVRSHITVSLYEFDSRASPKFGRQVVSKSESPLVQRLRCTKRSKARMKHVQLHAHADHTFVASLVPGAGKLREAAVVRAGEGAENPNVKECLLKPATIEPCPAERHCWWLHYEPGGARQ